MLFPVLISLLVVATLTLFAISAILIHQQQLEKAERRTATDPDAVTVTLGDLATGIGDVDDHALAKLQLELMARQQMAEIIG